jgi:transposase
MRESVVHGSRFLLFDGHRLLTASRGCDLAELGYDSKVRHRPQVNLIYAFSMGEANAEPVYYKRYSGGTTDVGAYPDVLEEAGMWGEDCIAITDKGFSSEDDFAKLLELGLDYVSPLKRNNRFTKGKLPEGPSGWDEAFTYNGRGICCMTLPQDGFVVHVYLDTELYFREFSDATARLEGREDAKAARAEAERGRRERGKGRLSDEQLAKLDPVSITDSLADRKAMGTISVRTNRADLSAKTVYCILKQRQAVEQFFKTYDDTLDFEATWMRSDEAMEGLLFLNHLSATIATDITEMIYDAGHSRDTSYRDCVEMAKKMRACRFADGGWQAVPPIKKRLPLYKELGMDPYDLRLLEMDPL